MTELCHNCILSNLANQISFGSKAPSCVNAEEFAVSSKRDVGNASKEAWNLHLLTANETCSKRSKCNPLVLLFYVPPIHNICCDTTMRLDLNQMLPSVCMFQLNSLSMQPAAFKNSQIACTRSIHAVICHGCHCPQRRCVVGVSIERKSFLSFSNARVTQNSGKHVVYSKYLQTPWLKSHSTSETYIIRLVQLVWMGQTLLSRKLI